MPIEGPLHELAISDVLQLLDLSRKTGVLTVEREGAETPVRVHLDEGSIVGVHAVGHTRPLAELLLLAGRATQRQIDSALERQAREPDRLIGAHLVEEGVPEVEIRRQLHFQIEELVYDLVRLRAGRFVFREAERPVVPGVAVRVKTESLLMEAMRRLDEWEALSPGGPQAELVPALVDAPSDAPLLELQPLEWEVLAGIDGERTLRAIAREVGQGEFEVAKAVFGLISAGVVEVGARRRATRPAALGEGDGGVGALREGLTAAEQGQWSAARDAFERAIARDPLLAPGYYHLALAAVRQGDLGAAEEALRTHLRLERAAGVQRARAERALAAVHELRQVLDQEEQR